MKNNEKRRLRRENQAKSLSYSITITPEIPKENISNLKYWSPLDRNITNATSQGNNKRLTANNWFKPSYYKTGNDEVPRNKSQNTRILPQYCDSLMNKRLINTAKSKDERIKVAQKMKEKILNTKRREIKIRIK